VKVLVVDDNNVDLTLLENILEESGFEVTTAKDGDEALALYSKGVFDAALLDWRMPPSGGLNLCQEIRNHDRKTGRYCYIIMITAKKEKEDEVRAFESGVNDFMSKPVDKDILIARLSAGIRIIRTLEDLYMIQD